MKFRSISRPLLVSGVLSLLAAAGLLFVRGNHTTNVPAMPDSVVPGPTGRASTTPRNGADPVVESHSEKRSLTSSEPLPVQLEKIEAAEALSTLEPYLHSAVPEIRAAAVNAMVRRGESDAAPLLSAAAEKLPPDEAAPLLEAARFLELPDATDIFEESSSAPKARQSRAQTRWQGKDRKPEESNAP